MNADVERAAVRLLAERASPSLSIRELHALLVAEVGPGVGSYARFRDDIDRRGDVFAIVLPDDPLTGAGAWPGTLLTEYRGALRDAGVDAEPRVVLARSRTRARTHGAVRIAEPRTLPEPAPGLAGQLGASLLELLDRAQDDPALQRLLGSAMADAPVIARVLDPHSLPESTDR
ncbi:MAG: hypothetical protein L0271_07160 [Gemmatimonadetes bacterium]|nr:hypothetical protein [Gemmatimonadota bacterium]